VITAIVSVARMVKIIPSKRGARLIQVKAAVAQACNPYEIGWMVALVAGISFIGYVAIKVAGPRAGVLLAP
jgi:uncharacterized membrane protein (DUF4010 family)